MASKGLLEQHAAVLARDPLAEPLINYAQLDPLKGIAGLLDQTISVVNEKMAAMQVCASYTVLSACLMRCT